jgi:hypothetical protein
MRTMSIIIEAIKIVGSANPPMSSNFRIIIYIYRA